jgi:hypothetical protein
VLLVQAALVEAVTAVALVVQLELLQMELLTLEVVAAVARSIVPTVKTAALALSSLKCLTM